MERKVKVFNIEDFSVDDGPGLRTVIFFKGCSLRCKWCHNPESLECRDQVMIYDDKCIGCGECFRSCPQGAHRLSGDLHVIDSDKCRSCMTCTENCFSGALVRVGYFIEPEVIEKRILRNRGYFQESGGGVTFSGGESMLQVDVLERLLVFCRENGIHTAVDTCGNVPWEYYERVIPCTDLFLYDLKAIDPEVHRFCTGVDNVRILDNFRRLQERGCRLLVRVPYVPGYNDEELPKIAEFLKQYPDIPAELLGYHTLGLSKYRALRLPAIEAYSPTIKEMEELKARYGFRP